MRILMNMFATAGLTLALAGSGLGQFRHSLPILPDPRLTPGDALDVTKDDVCTPGYAEKVRDVPADVKRQVYQEYGIASHRPGDFEVDHLISLELGGSNSIRNLWPQSYKTKPWNAHVKDVLENELHREVCSGAIDLKTAQRAIAGNWITAYKRYCHSGGVSGGGFLSRFHPRGLGSAAARPQAVSTGKVWVNLSSGVYWRPGTRYYGKTKRGQYMSEQAAIRAGYHPSRGQ